MSDGRVIKEGEVAHYIEVFAYHRADFRQDDRIQFAITTFNEPLEIIAHVKGRVDENMTIIPEFRLSPLGDAFQIHSFVRFAAKATQIISENKYEPSIATNLENTPDFQQSFTYRNLVFKRGRLFTSQQMQSSSNPKPFVFSIDENEAFPGYFPENNTLLTIFGHCFESNVTCGIDRDTGILEMFNQSGLNQTSYMYRAFNFSVPWECGERFCIFTNLMTGEHYEIPSDLRTFSGEHKGRRLALVPLLTIESPLVIDQLNLQGSSSPNPGNAWNFVVAVGLVLGFL
ncbi:unnamed protein product [Bursaphelenchus xylophilus]|nr:unnamed protein product [Bursaphelenchus xylophilus]CAG9078950.1 unnamed protein product [Bursaphelenchus xylophilus]